MIDAAQIRPLGVWHFTDGMALGEAEEFAGRLDQLGYSALWLPDTVGRDPFAHIAHLARSTTRLVFATGIASIWHRHPGAMAQASNTLADQSGGRFILGLGVSHQLMVSAVRQMDYSKPLTKMREYLTAMDSAPYSAPAPADPAPNYRNNWKRLGFSDEQIDRRDPLFVDSIVAWGDRDAILKRLDDHYQAGADHVCIQPLPIDSNPGVDWTALEALAP